MTVIKKYNSGNSQWEPIAGGIQGTTGAQGTTGSQGATGIQGAAGYIDNRYLQVIAVEKTTALANGTDIIGAIEVPITGTITSLRAKTTSGTATITFKLNGSSIGSVNATNSGVNSSISQSVTAFDDLTLDVSSASGSGLVVTLTITGV